MSFIGNEGIHVAWAENLTPEDFFEIFTDGGIIDNLMRQTNSFRPYSLMKQWMPTEWEKMFIFLAMLIMMGITHKPYHVQV